MPKVGFKDRNGLACSVSVATVDAFCSKKELGILFMLLFRFKREKDILVPVVSSDLSYFAISGEL
jgi:hypothetical protein